MAKATKKDPGFKISTYTDDGRIFFYYVPTADKAREHSAAIVDGGYRHNDGKGSFEHYPSHRIKKVKVSGKPVPTNYPDEVEGT